MQHLFSVYVGNLPYQITEEDLSSVFSEYGIVKRVYLPTDRETGRKRGFGFVEMDGEAEEKIAIEALDGAHWMGRDMKVKLAKPRQNEDSSGDRRRKNSLSRSY